MTDNNEHRTGRAARMPRPMADEHSTGRAPRSVADEHSTGRAARRPAAARTTGTPANKWPEVFTLNGKDYNKVRVISDTSGEAQILEVNASGHRYALKLYYNDPESRPNRAVLDKIRRLSGNGLLVNLIDFGQWSNPLLPGESLDYELMDYCEGGSMEDVVLRGDEKALGNVAIRMASAIDFLDKHGILHRDIKPGNFFYADAARTEVVLADFGISMECATGTTCKVDEMRTPVYAAPEFYTHVPGEPAEIDVRSDYYSLGVSLLCLWLGKARLTANESVLLKNKLAETLPYPTDMSPHMLSLIRSLTRLKAADRCSFDDIKRWAKGEILDNTADDNSAGGFHVVFNSAKGQVAGSQAELAAYLVADPALGKKYIYSGRVTRWLEETGCNEVAVNVEEVAERLYPQNQDAGLMAVAFMLDPAMPYTDPQGGTHTDPAEIGEHIFNNIGDIAPEVMNKDTQLKVFLRAVGLRKSVERLDEYVDQIGRDNQDQALASLMMAYLLNGKLPFTISNAYSSESIKSYAVNTVDELLSAVMMLGDVDGDTEALIWSPAFTVWLAARNPALAGKIRNLIDSEEEDEESLYYRASSTYRILYELDPRTDYYCNTDAESEYYTHDIFDIGMMMNGWLTEYITGKADSFNVNQICDMNNSRLGDYLRAKGEEYADYIGWAQYCTDLHSDENSEKAGPYNMMYGAFKTITGFLGAAPYYVIGDTALYELDDLKRLPRKVISENINHDKDLGIDTTTAPIPALDAWIALFFQENPGADLSERFRYEKLTVEFIDFIRLYAPQAEYVQRYDEAIESVDNSSQNLTESRSSLSKIRMVFSLIWLVPIALIIYLTFGRMPSLTPFWIDNTLFISSALFVAITPLYAMRGFGWSRSFFGGLFTALGAWGLSFVGINSCTTANANAGYVVLALTGILLLFYYLALFHTKRRPVNRQLDPANPGFEFRELDALHFAFKDDSDEYTSNPIIKFVEGQRTYDQQEIQHAWITGVIGLIVFAGLAIGYGMAPAY